MNLWGMGWMTPHGKWYEGQGLRRPFSLAHTGISGRDVPVQRWPNLAIAFPVS